MTGNDGASLGKIVRKLATVPWVTVMLNEIARAVVGMSQFPLAPQTVTTYVSAALRGVERGPTLSEPALVSISRHGTIGMNTSGAVAPNPLACCTTPNVPATKAAIEAKAIERFIRLSPFSLNAHTGDRCKDRIVPDWIRRVIADGSVQRCQGWTVAAEVNRLGRSLASGWTAVRKRRRGQCSSGSS